MGNCCSSQSDLDHAGQTQPSGHHASHTSQGSYGAGHHGSQGRSSLPQQYEMQSTTGRHGRDSRARTSSSLSSGASQNPQNTVTQGRNRQFLARPDGKEYTRTARPGQQKGKWNKVEQSHGEGSSSSTSRRLQLYVVFQRQSEGEPDHWSLSACDGENGDTRGKVWQVKGDATMMHPQHADNVDVLMSNSCRGFVILNRNLTPEQLAIVDKVARSERAPSAPNQRAVRENCQGWTMRVVRRLEAKGVVEKYKVDELQALMQGLN
ncbi:hypothetical protein CONLIGDRAFT_513369 [Coniochaeta ligniaria NRRL 30616]|uniref:Uncharacterized protein n=1 Tax=Coniochaeta ligniaria NRRL 30616 TaxID=1408157 RepID=A0A1J7IY09_9PEZI|nr:hypothetical protein CONLIGDRAFT_513369 [Coniochaeta ligniaria NRRL 30616]